VILRALCIFFFAVLSATSRAQTAVDSPGERADGTQLEALAKKIDEQNAKIDTLSQQIQKLEQSLSGSKMIGIPETPAPAASPAASVSTTSEATRTASGSTHTVARGETLTAIAKMHKVSIEDLQKSNHITDDRKLQIGQTLVIPSGGSTPSASPTVSATPHS
jgi:LysM repeat protein